MSSTEELNPFAMCNVVWLMNQRLLSEIYFRFYWNIPTFMCNKHGFNFANLQEEYGIIQNDEDGFR